MPRSNRLRDSRDAALDQPSWDDLSNRLLVLVSDPDERLVPEDLVLALRERSPTLVLHAVCLQEALRFDLRVERVRLDLIHRGHHCGIRDEVHHAVRREIADADRLCTPFPVEVLHRPPRAVHVSDRLVDQIEVDVVDLETPQRTLERLDGAFAPGVADPDLGSNEQFTSRNAG